MCIAIIKNKNVKMPDKDILKICFDNNSDGAGFAFYRNGLIHIKKGFFTFNGFMEAIDKANIKSEEPMLIHFRVATHGKINIDNCHPFPVTNKFSKMIFPNIITNDDVMVHNGKLDIGITSSMYSDSMHMAKALYQLDRTYYKDLIDYLIKPTEKNKRGNRIAILTHNGEIEKYGIGWIKDKNIWYSNDSYKINSTYKSKKTTKVYKKNVYLGY